LDPVQFGNIRNVSGKWASCIRLIEPFQCQTLQVIDLEENEAAFSVAVVQFRNNPHASTPGEQFIVVGTGQNVTLTPRSCTAGYLRVYRIVQGENGVLRLDFIHRTPVDETPYALLAFQGRLLVGAGRALRIYDIGKKKMLRKCEVKVSNRTPIFGSIHIFIKMNNRLFQIVLFHSIHKVTVLWPLTFKNLYIMWFINMLITV
jgi:splicing factor 3B subunit 3